MYLNISTSLSNCEPLWMYYKHAVWEQQQEEWSLLVLSMLTVKRTTCSINLLLPAFKWMFHVAIKLISFKFCLRAVCLLCVIKKTRLCTVWQPSLPLNDSVTPPQVCCKVSELNSSVLTCYTWHHLEMSCVDVKNRSALGSQTLQGSKWEKTSWAMLDYVFLYLDFVCVSSSLWFPKSQWGMLDGDYFGGIVVKEDFEALNSSDWTEPFETQMSFHLDLWMSEWMCCRVYTHFTEACKCYSAVQIFYIYISVFLYINNAL